MAETGFPSATPRANEPLNDIAILSRFNGVAPSNHAREAMADLDFVVVMATYYDLTTKDGVFRFGLAMETLRRFNEEADDLNLNIAVVVADASPHHAITRPAFELHGATVIDATKNGGIAPQLQLAVAYAYQRGAQNVLKIDPEKYGLAEVLPGIADEIGRNDILCIQRSPGGSFDTLPLYQQETERRMSRALAALGLPEDTASGIYCLSRRGQLIWLAYDPTTHGKMWEILWYPMLDAIYTYGASVGGTFLPFPHPYEMTLAEEGLLVHGSEESEVVAAKWRQKRDDQEQLIVPKVTAYAANLGVEPKDDPDREWII